MKDTAQDPLTDPAFRRALLSYYDAHARELPWRGESDPYRVLVSEVMLQQTRVETVKGYYGRWLERFPDVESLAGASEDEVLKAWEGLGYYRRARNLRRAALCVRDGTGSFPSSHRLLRELPGVGDYTAGAVASIAFGEAVPAVDGNVRRVFARLFGESAPTAAWLRKRAASLVDPARPGDWNQAVMELGATVCAPAGPRCDACPVARWCVARATSRQGDLPAPQKRARVRSERISLAVLERDGHVLLVRRPSDGLLGGMWAFPEEDPGELAGRLGCLPLGEPTALPEVVHRFTHLEATYLPVWVRCESGPDSDCATPDGRLGRPHRGHPAGSADGAADAIWVDAERADDFALPVAQKKVLHSWTEAKKSR